MRCMGRGRPALAVDVHPPPPPPPPGAPLELHVSLCSILRHQPLQVRLVDRAPPCHTTTLRGSMLLGRASEAGAEPSKDSSLSLSDPPAAVPLAFALPPAEEEEEGVAEAVAAFIKGAETEAEVGTV